MDAIQDPRLDAVIKLADERDWTVDELIDAVIVAASKAATRQVCDELVAQGKLEDLGGGKYRKVKARPKAA